MQIHAIVELEEGTLTLTIGTLDGQQRRILKCQRQPLPELGRDQVIAALRSLGSDPLLGAAGVHVVLADRRMHHFVATVPRLSAAEANGFVMREALRVAGVTSAEGALVAPALLRRLSGGRLVIGVTALGKSVWDPIQDAFRSAGIAVLSLHSMESCMAMAAAGQSERTAVLDCSSGRARFVLCDGEWAAQVRRFMVGGGGEGDGAALVAQLAMELPRTFDWLRETGHQSPQVLVLGTRTELDDESREMLRGDLDRVMVAPIEFTLAPEAGKPGLAAAMLLRSLCAGQQRPSLLAAPRIVLPWGKPQFVAIAAAGVVALVGSWSAVMDGTTLMTLNTDLSEARADQQRLAQQASVTVEVPVVAAVEDPAADRLQQALSMRRPISRLASEVSNSASEGMHLDALQFASTEKVVVSGVVQGGSQREALTRLAAFAQKLRDLPYLRVGGQEDVSQVAGQPNTFRFRLSLSWRNT